MELFSSLTSDKTLFLMAIILTVMGVFILKLGNMVAGVLLILLGSIFFAATLDKLLKGKTPPFQPEDPYSFYWKPIFILIAIIGAIILYVGWIR